MQKKLEELAAGICRSNSSILQFSQEKLDLEVVEGTDYTGEFRIQSAGNMTVQGMICSSSPRMECYSPKFQGETMIQRFVFHSDVWQKAIPRREVFILSAARGNTTFLFLCLFPGITRTAPQEK